MHYSYLSSIINPKWVIISWRQHLINLIAIAIDTNGQFTSLNSESISITINIGLKIRITNHNLISIPHNIEYSFTLFDIDFVAVSHQIEMPFLIVKVIGLILSCYVLISHVHLSSFKYAIKTSIF